MKQQNEQLGRYIERLIELRNGMAQTLKLELNHPLFNEMNSRMNKASVLQNSHMPEQDLLEETRKLIFGY